MRISVAERYRETYRLNWLFVGSMGVNFAVWGAFGVAAYYWL